MNTILRDWTVMTSNYYQPSGQAPARGVAVILAFSLAAVPMTVLYAWASVAAGFGYGFLILVFMSLFLALLVRQAAGHGKIRNPRWMGRAGAACGLFLWYVHWSAWLAYANGADTGLYLAIHPSAMGEAMLARLTGASDVKAGFLAVCWLIELGLFMLPCALGGRNRATEPFCEACGQWAEKVDVPVRFHPIRDADGVRRCLEADPSQALVLLQPCIDDVPAYTDLEMYRCPGGDAFITILNFVAVAPGSQEHRDTAAMLDLPAEKVELSYEADAPVVELLKLPAAITGQLVRRWEANVRASGTNTDGVTQA